MTLQMMIIIAVVILIPILSYMGYQWYQTQQKAKDDETKGDLLSGSTLQPNYTPPPAQPKQSRVTISPSTIVSLAEDVDNSIHTFSEDDTATIISTFEKNVRTKKDLADLNSALKDRSINVLDILKKDLTVGQVQQFVSWENSLPDYVPYVSKLS